MPSGQRGFSDHDAKGIRIRVYDRDNSDSEVVVKWSEIDARIRLLIQSDRYLSPYEKSQIILKKQEYVSPVLPRRAGRGAPGYQEEENSALVREPVNILKGDTVFVGTDSFLVLFYGEEEVLLQDSRYPLLTEKMSRTIFDQKIRENPLNSQIKHQPLIQSQSSIVDSDIVEPDKKLEGLAEYGKGDQVLISTPSGGEQLAQIEKIDEVSVLITVGLDEDKTQAIERDTFDELVRVDDRNDHLYSEEQFVPAWEKEKPEPKPQTVVVTKSLEARNTYHITDDGLATGSPKVKYVANVSAIRLLQKIESEDRLATSSEQDILAKYVGWGGLPMAFDEQQWPNEYRELKSLLSENEFESARESTLNAHYTSPVIIRAIYEAVERMGFRRGNILEPAMGIGNFFGCAPASMSDSRFYGVELDSISGRIAKQLYQDANIAIQGFEESSLPDSFFDLAIGNVPFGQYKIADKRYDKNNFLVHDYFFAKSLDKVRPGGVIAFITSKGTMDKQSPAVRKYISRRAELLGAIRLPNDAFKANAGTEVTSDILFFQKRERMVDLDQDWIHLSTTDEGITVNQYFVDHPEMILGHLVNTTNQFGRLDTACTPIQDVRLSDLLSDAITNIRGVIEQAIEETSETQSISIPADPNVRNFSFCVIDGEIYYRKNSRMKKETVSTMSEKRIKGMIRIRDCMRELIEYQVNDYSNDVITSCRLRLNTIYDDFTKEYGLVSNRANTQAFVKDSSCDLVRSLEELNEDGTLKKKADMFTKRTIKKHTVVSHVSTGIEALAVSLSEKAKVDMPYMCQLTDLSSEQLENELVGVIFRDPMKAENSEFPFETADAYLSGNVREKLLIAQQCAKTDPVYLANVTALQSVQPQALTASEINVRLGATWIPEEDIKQFVFDLIEPPFWVSNYMEVHYSPLTADWNISNKTRDHGNIKANKVYGTDRANAYKIIEETLNLRDVRIFDTEVDENGKKTSVLNRKETTIAQQKQDLIKTEFSSWIWKDPRRRERLVKRYNDLFNSTRPQTFDGRHISFGGMNPEIQLRTHQVDAVARVLYGGNSLLAHVVGAGKTFEMVASAMETKRLGITQKSLFVVPNHLIEQWAADFLQLYPAANLLVSTKKDFEPASRKRFCSRIATGDYDAVIIGHSQFEKIPMSFERQRAMLQRQIDDIVAGISDLRHNRGDSFTIKQLEKTKKTIKVKMDKLNDTSRKDDVVTFEELGVDRLFVDEAHNYKNLFLYTKMRNVGGIAQTEAQKSSDLFMKCQYLDEITGGRGVVFATGTPISNSMVELYTMQRYLQYGTLSRQNLQHFDCWASTYGETVTAIELAPEGTGYRAKTRFAKFYNLPELMNTFKEIADIQTADMLDLDVPKATFHNVVVKPSEYQKAIVHELSVRADRVRAKMVQPTEDNMLKITNDGRKLALDQRLINPELPDDPESKTSVCSNNVYSIWEKGKEKHLTQLVFCDLSTPHYDGSFNVYNDIKDKLIAKGIPEEEIKFIHDAKTDAQKDELFEKVRSGRVRVLLGSTSKMGAGTNVQNYLAASHDLDCPWRPADLEQRAGRIIRQGNRNKEVDIYRYVTEGTFDAYLFQLVENKQRFISQIMTSKSPVRSAEDIDEASLSYAEIKALATGNPHIKEKMDLDIEVAKLKLLKADHLSQKYALEDSLLKRFPETIKQLEKSIEGYERDIDLVAKETVETEDGISPMTISKQEYTKKEEAGQAILKACKSMKNPDPIQIGHYRGLQLTLSFDSFTKEYMLQLRGAQSYPVVLGGDLYGNLIRIDNVIESIPKRKDSALAQLANTRTQRDNAVKEIDKPFAQESALAEKQNRLAELNSMLNMDDAHSEHMDMETDEREEEEDSIKRTRPEPEEELER